jgi:hypothetical protein
MAEEMNAGDNLLLANPAKDAYLEVMREDAGAMTLDQYRENYLDGFRDERPAAARPNNLDDLLRYTDFRLRESWRLPDQDGAEVAEVVFDVKLARQNLTYRARFFKPRGGTEVYTVVAWSHRRRLEQIEGEIRRSMDSFRLLRDG